LEERVRERRLSFSWTATVPLHPSVLVLLSVSVLNEKRASSPLPSPPKEEREARQGWWNASSP
jgi:hypothetical protein